MMMNPPHGRADSIKIEVEERLEEARVQEQNGILARGVGLRSPEKDMGVHWLAFLGWTCTTVGAKHYCCAE